MDKAKRKRLEDKGWKVGSTKEFLDLSDAEATLVEIKLALSREFEVRRKKLGYTQVRVAKLLDSSQSRVAKMEAGDRSVSLDLLLRGLLVLGLKPRNLATVFSSSSAPMTRKRVKRSASKKKKSPQR